MTAENPLTQKTLAAFHRGESPRSYQLFGAHRHQEQHREGYRFALWAPDVKTVRVAGDFDGWQGKTSMRPLAADGSVWQAFIPEAQEGQLYKFILETADGETFYKADPFAFFAEKRPGTASRLADLSYVWQDGQWLSSRREQSHFQRPLNIYEVHLGSWRQHKADDHRRKGTEDPGSSSGTAENPHGGVFYTYRELAETLPAYAAEMGYTHVELMPVMEHPFDGSWGYQITGYYAPTSRYGTPQEFKYLIDRLHQAGIGVILDWVPGHFCQDAHGLCLFNGKPLYEAEKHVEWGTYKFDYHRPEIRSFLISNAFFWLEEYHADGLRVDGVSSMLYLNYGIDDEKQKRYNIYGGEQNLDAQAFLQDLNRQIGEAFPDVFTVAEESTAWPLVTRPPSEGGLGFHYKWDMGWMNDTLRYCALDFPFRDGSHDLLTFSMMYAFNENFVLPLSHDEVVHGKCSLMTRMPGDYWRQFAGLRLLLMYQMCHSGAKLTFMGSEIAPFIEWRYYEELEWFLLDYEAHAKHQCFVRALNHLYRDQPSFWQQAYSWDGYQWLDAENRRQSILVFVRQGTEADDFTVILLNFQPHTYERFKIGVPRAGVYQEIFNSNDPAFGGTGHLNPLPLATCRGSYHGQEQYLEVCVPPIGGIVLAPAALDPDNQIDNPEEDICLQTKNNLNSNTKQNF